jgi:hypothetical protein
VLCVANDVDHAIAEILPAHCMDPTDFEARYPARRARALGCPPDDQLRGLCTSPAPLLQRAASAAARRHRPWREEERE